MDRKTYALTDGSKIYQFRDMNDEELAVQSAKIDAADLSWIVYVEKEFLEKAEKKSIDGAFYVGGGARVMGYSDVTPYTVTWISPSGKTMHINMCETKLLNGANSGEEDALVVTPGGFSAHTEGIQRWAIYTDLVPIYPTVTARLTKRGWTCQMGRVKPGWACYYDFNF